MAINAVNSFFPSQVVSDQEKVSQDYGLQVGRAIQNEWFSSNSGSTRFRSNQTTFHNLRLYARGEQPVQKYKDELSINGDLSYLNLDWKPVPILSKFVDIVVNGIADRSFDITTYSQDPYGVSKRTAYMESIIRDKQTEELNNFAQENFGINLFENPPETLPDSQEELDIHMQLTYKQGIEIAEETALNTLLDENRYDLTKRRTYLDLATLGIGAVKNNFSESEGVTIDYVDPAYLVYSYTEDPYFQDIYYAGEVKFVPINEIKKQFPNLTQDQLERIQQQGTQNYGVFDTNVGNGYNNNRDSNVIQVLYFNYKTYMNEVYKVKETATGATKIIVRDDQFDPPVEMLEEQFGKMSRSLEVLYEGVMIVGTDIMLKWEMAKNMMRPKSDVSKVKMNYAITAPRMYKGRIESLVSKCTGFADMVQLTHLKLQQVLQRMIPDGVYLDADGINEVDLGNGTNYNPQEALNMFFQTGSIIGRSFTQDGDMNPGKVPIQEVPTGSGGQKLQTLISTYNYYLQMIRDVTGLNEARDGSTPDSRALVGVQKLAAANSNTATRHILDSGLYLTKELCECLSLRISDIIEYHPAKEAFITKIGRFNVGLLEEMSDLYMHDFGISLELTPDEEQKSLLENNIQAALQQGSIDLSDAIDIREVRNIKLANQLLKVKQKKRQERLQVEQQANIQAQAQANAQAQQVAAQAEIQKDQALFQTKAQLEQLKGQLRQQEMATEVAAKKELMGLEFQYNMQLKGVEVDGAKSKEKEVEDRKDQRTRIQGTQQSEMINQRKNDLPPKNFESAGNDVMGGGFGLGAFDPR
tara:strand:+ start:1898 stop:4330 length:2433 start_codon:yes stop_codon:yes gene_type:complete